jgi:hypothetical protein
MTSEVVSRFVKKLQDGRTPWSRVNYVGVKVGFEQQGCGDADYIVLEGQPVNKEAYCIGASNLLTLASGGAVWASLRGPEKFDALNAAKVACWQNIEGGYGWEAATVLDPEELAEKLEKAYIVITPSGFWRKRAREVVRRR